MPVSATNLRQNIYAMLDEALATGQPIEIERKGKTLRIVPPQIEAPDDVVCEFPRLARLKNLNWVVGDIDKLVNVTWSHDFTKLVKKPALKLKRKKA
jgi:hypothetical protein